MQHHFTMNINLLESTIEMAMATRIPVTRICRAAGVTSRWYYKMLSGEIKDPSVRRVQRIYDYLLSEREQNKAA